MTTIEVRASPPAKRNRSSVSAKGKKPKQTQHTSSGRVTKHDRILTLLSRSEGATVCELMEATGWQQHSIRGFLAGTVKKKLGLKLTSSRSDGVLRCYRIQTKRGR